MQTELSTKCPIKVVPHRHAQTKRGLHWFKTSFQLPDNSIANSYGLIPNKEVWSYRRTISNKQSNKTLHHSSTGTEHGKVGNNATLHLQNNI